MAEEKRIKFQYGNKVGEIPESKLQEFQQRFPDAKIIYNEQPEPQAQEPQRTEAIYTEETRKDVADVQEKRKNRLGLFGEALRDSSNLQNINVDSTLNYAAKSFDETEAPIITNSDERERVAKQHSELSEDVSSALMSKRGDILAQERYKESERVRDRGFLGQMMHYATAAESGNDPFMRSQTAMRDNKEQVSLNAANKLLEGSRKTIDAVNALASGETIFGQTARGLKDGAWDFDTWAFGLTDLADVNTLYAAAQKSENGEELTQDEEMLLESAAIDMAVNYYYSDALSRGYKAGRVTGESLPFMLEMAINPLSRSGNVLAKAMLKRIQRKGLHKFAKEGAEKGVQTAVKSAISQSVNPIKWGTRLVGDVAGAVGMASTTGAAATIADAKSRKMGQATFDIDPDSGELVFAGMDGGVGTWKEAYGKALGAKAIENYSEMFGNYFSPILSGAGKAIRGSSLKLGNALDFLDNAVNKSAWGKMVRDFTKVTRWDGVIAEFAEEQVGGILNALIVGDQTLDTDEDTGVFNASNMLDTFLGVSLLGGAISVAKAVGYKNPITRYKQDLILANSRAIKHFGEEKWGEIIQQVGSYDLTNNEEQNQAYWLSRDMDKESKKIFLEYLGAEAGLQGARIAQKERILSKDSDAIGREMEGIYEEYSNGATDENRNELLHSFKIVNTSPLRQSLGETPVEEIVAMAQQEEKNGNKERARELLGYARARQATTSFRDYRLREKESEAKTFRGYVNRTKFKDTNRIRYAMLDNGVIGNIVDEAGESVTVITPQGERVILPKSKILYEQESTVDTVMKNWSDNYEAELDRELQSLYAEPTQEEVAQAEQKLENQVVSLKLNDRVLLKQEDGSIIEGSIEQIDSDSNLYWVKTKDNGIMQMSKDELMSAIVPGQANEAEEEQGDDSQGGPVQPTKPVQPTPPIQPNPPTPGAAPIAEEEIDELEGYYRDEEKKKVDYDKLLEDKPEVFIDIYGNKNGEDAVISALDMKIKAINEQIKKAEKTKSKKTSLNDIEDINDEIAEYNKKIETLEGLKKGVIQKKAQADAEKAKQEAIQAGGKQTEITFDNVPDVSEDKASDARARGFRMQEGVKIDRQEPIDSKKGNKTNVSFASGVSQEGEFAIIDAKSAVPSHINGKLNLKHFLPEAQPKDRVDKASQSAREEIAKNINPGEITRGETAYSGSPVVNTRGEVIQGNGRTDALQYMYESFPEQAQKYKQFLIDNAAEFGLNPADIESMESPMLVRMVDVDDNTAIGLGQHTASDLESGGVQSLRSNEISNMLGNDLGNVSDMLLETEDEDASLSSVIGSNGRKALQYLLGRGIINNTQYQSAFNEDGELTSEAIESLKGVLQSALFANAPDNIKKWFAKLPKSAQKALLQVAHRDMMSGESDRIMEDIQSAIQLYYQLSMDADFAKVKTVEDFDNYVKNLWGQQTNLFAEGVPIEKFSKFAVELAKHFKFKKEKELKAIFNELFDTIQGVVDLFGNNAPKSSVEAIKQIFNIDYGTAEKTTDNTSDKESGSGVLVQDDRESDEGRRGSKTGDTVTGGTKEEGQPSEPSGTSTTGSSEDVSGSTEGQGEGVAEQGQSQPTSIFDAAAEISEREQGEAEDKQEEKIEITAELIDSLPIDDVIKNYAKLYLQGKKNLLTTQSFKAVEDYVYNAQGQSGGVGSTANGTQLGSTPNDAAIRGVGRSGESDRPMDRGQGNGDVSEIRSSGENSEDNVLLPDGTRSDSGMESNPSVPSDAGSTLGGGRSDSGSTGDNVGKRGRPKGSRGVSKSDARGQAQTKSTTDESIASADSLIDEALAELEEILKEASSTLNAGFNPIVLKVIPATAKLGYGLVKKGFYTFKKWYSQMQTSAGPLLRNAFSVEEIDELIKDMWDTEFTFNGETHTIQEWASIVEQEELRKMVKMSIEEKIKLQKSREDVETIISDLDNIRESLPFLLPKQQEDVQKAEVQFFSDEHKAKKYGNGKGILFTNGTGTGKTFTGLGIAKRFLKQGKGRILIVTAQDKKIKDWVRDAGYLGINATQLQDTKDKGKGVVVTQYANMYQNRALLEEEWDLIIYDESHKLMENKDGSETARSVMHYLLSNRDIEQAIRRMLRDHPLFMRELQLLGEIGKLEQDFKTLTSKTVSQYTKEERELYNKYQQDANNIRNLINNKKEEIDSLKIQQDRIVIEKMNDKEVVEKAQSAVDKTKVVFLSASPFNTAKNLGYTESYIFSYDPDAEENPNDTLLPSEKKGRERDNFVLEKFPSSHQRMSNGKVITRSEAQISNPEQSSREEVTFSEALQEQGTLSGRMLDSEYDYSRQFPRLNFRLSTIFNEIYRNLLEGGRFAALGESDAFKPLMKEYASYTEYFEALKTYASIDRIKEHLALGRKVLIFHRRRSNTAGGGMVRRLLNECVESAKASGGEGIDQFVKEYAEYLEWERTADLDFANYKIAETFATEEEKAEYQKELKKWEQKCKIAEQNGRPMPSRPQWKNLKSVAIYSGALTEKEKQEGAAKFNDDNSGVRIMIAQVASAKEGVDFHDKTGKNQRVEINLFLPESPLEFIQTEGRIYRIGNKSNAVFEYPLLGIDLELSSFASKINGRAQTAENLALGTMARGLRHSIARAALSMREMPVGGQQGVGGKMLDDASQQNKTDFDSAIQNYNEWKENQAEELSQKQVPDPIGERMVTWGFSQGGETVFIPYAGEGTIARYANPATRLVAFENSTSRFARLMMLCGGAGRKIENRLFDGSGVSYCDNIFHFRPSKSAQKELDDLELSWQRLADNGRMIFLTTTGTDFKGHWVNTAVRADIKLPTSLLGGEIRNLRIVVIDKQSNRDVLKEASANKVEVDLSDIQDEAALWEAIRGIQVPERAIDEVATIKKRVERVLNTHIANCGTIRKVKNYATGKMGPDVNSYNTSCSFRFKHSGRTSVAYRDFIGGTGLYVERFARLYLQFKDYINKNKHSNDMRTTQVVEEYQAWCQFCEALLGKTPTQIKNIALGLSENVVTGKIEVSELRDSIKGMLNGNAALDRLNDRVMKVAEQFGIEVEIAPSSNPIFSGKNSNTQGFYSVSGKKIWIKEEYINSSRTPNDKKAEVLLHETIHAVTSYALNAYEQGVLPKDSPLYQACADIKEVYESIKNDAAFAASIRGANGIDALNNEYGLTNVHEMMAELANPMFRAALKAKNLWEQVINGIKKILGIKVIDEAKEVNALNVLENALDTLLDNADKATFDRYSDPMSMLFGKKETLLPNSSEMHLAEHQIDVPDLLPTQESNVLFEDKGNENFENPNTSDIHFRTSKELDEEFGDAWREQQNEDGRHSTQVAKTKSTYEKIGKNLLDNGFNNVTILDASSGLGLGTQALREMGFKVDDVEPYPSENREAPTFSSYNAIDKEYDVVISNAVLNVIPDDWRADVLHQMAGVVKDGGKIIINTRPASQISKQGTEGKSRITLDSPSEILVKRGDKISAYQKGFTTQELMDWIKSELGEGWKVEKATNANSGISGEGSVLVTKEDSPISAERKRKAELNRVSRNVAKELVEKQAKKLGIKVKFISRQDFPEGHKRAKGMFNARTKEISICLENHSSAEDAIITVLHETVGHYGLRKLVGEKNFNDFLWKVFENATEDVRKKIVLISRERGFVGRNMEAAIEEYLSRLAENTEMYEEARGNGFFEKVRELFDALLKKVFGYGGKISERDLRYLLIRSYDNLTDPNPRGGIFDRARDIQVRNELNMNEDSMSDLPSDTHFREVSDAIDETTYDKRLAEKSFRFQEAYQDSMLGLKVLQEEIEKESGNKLKDYENAYQYENSVSSRNRYDQNIFKYQFQQPMIQAISDIMKAKGVSYEEVQKYAMAKSGLERNVVFAKRDAQAIYDEKYELLEKQFNSELNDNPANEEELRDAFSQRVKELEEERLQNEAEFRTRDYSALTAIFGGETTEEAEEMAGEFVEEFENGIESEIDNFWDKVNKASKYSLLKNKNSGLLSEDLYKKIDGMFEYYVPMRGFDEDTAEDMYDYYTNPQSPFSATIRSARGRTSKYEDPFAYICNIADSAILQSNKNRMKQRFLAMALNNKGSKFVNVSDRWIVETDMLDNNGKKIWEERQPEIPEDATPEQVSEALNNFNEQMQILRSQGKAKTVHSKLNIPYRALKQEHRNEHIVMAKMGGKSYMIYVLGNPRAAQAINGLTNPPRPNSKTLELIQSANRFVSSLYTTMSPKFILRNFFRDAIYSNFAITVKEDEKYKDLFNKNRLSAIWNIRSLMNKFENGTLNKDVEIERLFDEFMKNGGETGYSLLRDIDEFKKMNSEMIKELSGKKGAFTMAKNGSKKVIDTVEFVNRCAENIFRFTTYMSSRQYGRTIERSIIDAKNVSVNFNKKGSAQDYGANLFKNIYFFFNAAVQGLYNFYSLGKQNAKKFSMGVARWIAWGAAVPALNLFIGMIDGGDDDDYWDLPEWVRRNNLCLRIPFTEHYITIPLPIELRALYGIGEIITSSASGKAPHKNIAGEIALQMLDFLPINILEGNKGPNDSFFENVVQNMVPDLVAPITDAYIFNRDFTGRPIYKDYDYNKAEPSFTKAYAGTNKQLIEFTRVMNKMFGGDDYTPARLFDPVTGQRIDLNPARIEHILQGYFGGMFTIMNEAVKTVNSIVDPNGELEVRDVPFANILVQKNDEKTTSSFVNELYYYYKQEHQDNVRRLNKYEKDTNMIDEYNELEIEYGARRSIYEMYQEEIEDLQKSLKEEQDGNNDKTIVQYYKHMIEQKKKDLVESMLEYE